jgi:futalosine hydrolase
MPGIVDDRGGRGGGRPDGPGSTSSSTSTEAAIPGAGPAVAIVGAVALELEPLRAALVDAEPIEVGRKPATRGWLDQTPVLLLPGGMGKTNAAQALTSLLERGGIRGVLNVGVGGAYPGVGLHVGDVALATEEVYGDDGVEAPAGWISTEGIGIPLLERGELRRFNRFPLDAGLVTRAGERLAERGVAAVAGPFVTVSCCSGTERRGRQIAERFGAVCESMEGAALAHVAAIYGVPFLELRAISNAVEDRDLSRWRLRDAVAASCAAARLLVDLFEENRRGRSTHEARRSAG